VNHGLGKRTAARAFTQRRKRIRLAYGKQQQHRRY